MDLLTRILSNVKESETIAPHVDTPCLIWQGHKLNPPALPYGIVWSNGKDNLVHRRIYELTFGDLPRNIYVLHKCDVASCCNIDHLFSGTQKDNVHDMMSKGRNQIRQGEANHNAVLTDALVVEILRRQANGETATEVSKAMNINVATLDPIFQDRHWKHIPRPFSLFGF